MIKGENIICVSWLVWDSIPLVMHHMMSRLAKQNRVLFVDPPVAYSNLLLAPSFWRNHMKKTALWLRGVRRINENLHVYYPPPLLLQYGHLQATDNLNRFLTGYAIKRTAERLGLSNPILWIYHPYAIKPEGQFKEKLVCYDCNDDVGFFFSLRFNKRKKLSRMEADLSRSADIVFATSRHLYELRGAQNPNTHYLPSAVDTELFKRALLPGFAPAPELAALSKPVIGFVGGMVNAKMNWRWIKDAATAHPEWTFAFVGPCVEPPPHFISEQRNIIFFGAKDPSELPAFLKGFDVCLIPYQGEEFLRACQPTKAFEYLAAGKPVVSSFIPELEELKHIVRLSRDAGEFISDIEKALADGRDEAFVRSCVAASEGITWDGRVEAASHLIEKLL